MQVDEEVRIDEAVGGASRSLGEGISLIEALLVVQSELNQ